MTVPQNQQLSDADLELLSAYIDNRLAADERATLEQRLRDEPALRGTLDELRGTVALLRDLAPTPPPRSFALDPAAFAPRPSPLFGWLRLGATLASVLLALTFAVDLVGRGGLSGSAPAAAPAPLGLSQPQRSALTLTEAPAAAPAAENAAPTAAPAAPLVAPAAPAATAASAAGAASAAPTSAPAATTAPAVAVQATPEATGTTRQSADTTSATAAPAPAQKSSGPAGAYLAPSPAAPTATPAAGYAPPPTAAPIAPSGSQPPDTLVPQQPSADTTRVAPAAPAIRPIRLVEIGLASLALLLGVGALWARRQF